jgi:hypothetical protein
MTCRYGVDETFSEMYKTLQQMTPGVANDEEGRDVIAASVAVRALELFGEKMPAQLDAAIANAFTSALGAAMREFIKGLVPSHGLPTTEARRLQAKFRDLDNEMSLMLNRGVWGEVATGRTALVTEDTIIHALENIGADASQPSVARFLGVGSDAVKKFRKEKGFKSWEDMRAHYLRGGKN